MTGRRDPRTPHPLVNLITWVCALGILVAVAVAGGGRLWRLVGTLLTAPTPLAGRVAVAVGLGVVALVLALFFGWLLVVLVQAVVAAPDRRKKP